MIPAESRHSPRIEILEPQPERRIEVRIGTIEIHGPETTAPATVPVAAATAEPAPSTGGFDGFVRLRTYAPWGR